MAGNSPKPIHTVVDTLCLVIWHCDGLRLSVREWIMWHSALSGFDNAKIRSFDSLVDFRGGTWAIEGEEIRGALEFSEWFYEGGRKNRIAKKRKFAIICGGPLEGAGWQTYADQTDVPSNPFEIKVFHDRTAAIDWLGHADTNLLSYLPKTVSS